MYEELIVVPFYSFQSQCESVMGDPLGGVPSSSAYGIIGEALGMVS